ncbi:MAG TPA: nuclear transport factor 2 family protein [Pyrinomonadaceae bacterium]|jgi:hypothetical protein
MLKVEMVRRYVFVGCVLAVLVATLQGQMRQGRTRIQNNDEEALQRTEQEWLDALFAPPQHQSENALERVLASDFTASGEGGEIDRAAFLAAARVVADAYASINLDERRVRIYGDTAVSMGRATLTPRATDAMQNSVPTEIKVTRSIAVQSSTVNMSELAREEAANPHAPNSKPVAVHAPMPMPENLPVKRAADAGAPKQYRYTAIYIRRPRDWRVVALQLTPINEPRP